MPIYEYECLDCGANHEIMQKITEEPITVCPECGGRLKKMISNTSFVLKGTGWYATDYGSNRKKEEKADGDKGGKKENKTEKNSDQKRDTSSKAAAETKQAVSA